MRLPTPRSPPPRGPRRGADKARDTPGTVAPGRAAHKTTGGRMASETAYSGGLISPETHFSASM